MGRAARAASTGARYDISDELGTAVNVVPDGLRKQGRGRQATGVAFTRDPSTGEPGLYGEFLANAQGEDVVAGIRTPEPLAQMERTLPAGVRAAARNDATARGALPATCRTSSSPSRTNALYLLQTRSAKRTAAAAVKSAVDMVDEGLISREQAVTRIDPAQLDQLLHPMIDPTADWEVGGQGAERLAGRGLREDRARRGHCRAARRGRGERDPRPLGDDAGRHPRADPGRRASSPPTAA